LGAHRPRPQVRSFPQALTLLLSVCAWSRLMFDGCVGAGKSKRER
jgi:hypothetical protein